MNRKQPTLHMSRRITEKAVFLTFIILLFTYLFNIILSFIAKLSAGFLP